MLGFVWRGGAFLRAVTIGGAVEPAPSSANSSISAMAAS